jgi:site-specific DNA recombinase
LTPTHTQRHGRRLRYYVSNRLISGGTDPEGWRLPAPALEQAVADIIARHVADLANAHRLCAVPDLNTGETTRQRASDLTRALSTGAPDILGKLVAEGCLTKEHITLTLKAEALADQLGLTPMEIDPSALQVEVPFALRRRGVEGKIIAGDREPAPDKTLQCALAQAHAWTRDLLTCKSLCQIATKARHSDSYIRTRAQLTVLSPTIQRAILDGRQPPDLSLEQIIRKPIPLDWEVQARLYGFGRGPNHP